MKKGWNVDDYCNYVKLQLGGGVLSISTENDLPFIVEKMAFEELKNYMKNLQTMTVAYSTVINLKDKHVSTVKYVLRNRNNNISITGMDTNLFIYQTQGQYGINQWAKDQITYNLLINQVRNTLSSDMDFNYDQVNEVLYLYAQYPIPPSVTIAYIPEYTDVSEVYIPYWMNYLRRYAVAYAKEVEGRIRSKYSLNSGTYNLDGQTLLDEAHQELNAIREELNSNINITHTIS